jgi:hypothetical protein
MSRPGLIVAIFGLLGVVSILLTYPVYNNTFDEPAHITTGVDLLDRGEYPYRTLHPPPIRVLIAFGPYLSGIRGVDGTPEEKEQGVMHQGDHYWRTLSLARLSILPFFLLGLLVAWRWARHLFGVRAGVVGSLFFASQPVILGHAGLATTDMAACATIGLSLFFWSLWLEEATAKRSILFGVSVGFAILVKLSAVVFIPFGALAILLLRSGLGAERRVRVKGLFTSAVFTFVVIWAGYGLSLDPITHPEDRPHDPVDRLFGTSGTLHDLGNRIAEAPIVPAAAFLRAVNEVRALNEDSFAGYVLGKRLEGRGAWYFFPVALAVKTSLPFLLMALVGVFLALREARREGEWSMAAPAVGALAILAVGMISNVALGIRHVLPVYLLLSVTLGASAVALLDRGTAGKLVLGLFAVWQVGGTVVAHPDHLPYFNELVRNQEQVLVESDLDWGQDLHRLAGVLEEEGIEELQLAYFGTTDPRKMGITNFSEVAPEANSQGWVAISRTLLKLRPGYAWLDQRTPERVAGKSIEIHLVPERNLSNP